MKEETIKNIEAIEEEKKEYLKESQESSEEDGKDEVETEIDVLEFGLDDEEINELMENLRKLKETKTSFNFEVDDENELLINYEEGADVEGEE